MPIDYIKLRIREPKTIKRLENKLEFIGLDNRESGEVYNYPISTGKKDHKYRVQIKSSNLAYIDGSIHKVNQGGYNFKPFHFEDLLKGMFELCIQFRLLPHELEIVKLEIGYNVNIPWNDYVIIDRAIYYKTVPLKDIVNNPNACGKVANMGQKRIKFYSKSKQLDSTIKLDNLLRFEIHYSKHEPLIKHGVNTLEDLFKIDKLELLSKEVIATWCHILLIDDTLEGIEQERPESQRRYLKFTNPLLLNDVRRSNYFRKEKMKYNRLVKKRSTKNYHETIKLLLQNQIKHCLQKTEKWNGINQLKELYRIIKVD